MKKEHYIHRDRRQGNHFLSWRRTGIESAPTYRKLWYGRRTELVLSGLLITSLEEKADQDFLLFIQHKLFTIGSYLATDQENTETESRKVR